MKNELDSPGRMETASPKLWLLLAAVFSTTLLVAETPPGNSTIQFTCVTWETLPFDELFYGEGAAGEGLPLAIGKRVRSELHKMEGAEELQLSVRSEVEDKMIYQVVGKAPIQSDRMLFIIEKNRDPAGLPLRIFGLDDSLESFPAGEFRFLNFTGEPVSVDFSGARETVLPGEFCAVPANAAERGGFQPFFVRDMSGKTVFETRLFVRPRERKISIFLPPSKPGGRLNLRFLPEIIGLPPPGSPETSTTEPGATAETKP